MASSFGEYSASTMSTQRENDFTLYPYTQDQSYQSLYGLGTTFDSYESQPAFSYPNPDYSLNVNNNNNNNNNNNAKAKANYPYSPANSLTHSFDLQPPVLSSTSDSGASVHSAISSAIGSPAMGQQSVAEWTRIYSTQAPGIVPQEAYSNNMFGTTGYEFENIPALEKGPGCVGESSAISSSQPFSHASPSSLSMSSPRYVPPPHAGLASGSTPSNPRSSQSGPLKRATTIDVRQQQPPSDIRSPNAGMYAKTEFKSPATPPSIPRPTAQPLSPVLARVKGERRHSNAVPQRSRMIAYSLNQSLNQSPSLLDKTAISPVFPSSFFSQSSGMFNAPLDFSCVFPSPQLIHFTSS